MLALTADKIDKTDRRRPSLAARALGSPLVDLLLGPHGVDRYLELVRPSSTVKEARAEVTAVHRQTARSVTMTLRPNQAWRGFAAGQFVRAGFEIDGVRRTRTYSPASSAQRGRDLLELTVTEHPQGLVSRHLCRNLHPGTIVHLGPAQGEFVLPAERPAHVKLISGGSGITPVMSMLRTLCDEGHDGEIEFLHYARTRADWLYERELLKLSRRHPRLRVSNRASRRDGHLDAAGLGRVGDTTWAAVCGPPSLGDGAREAWRAAGGDPERLVAETFTAPTSTIAGQAAQGSLRFLRSGATAEVGPGTLLEQAEAAGLSPDFGCRMGICHTCTCRKAAGAVRNVRTGQVSEEEHEDIQLCIHVPVGDVALEL